MPSYTEHYNLIKPNKTDNYNVDVANTNNDVIDEELYKRVEKVAGKGLSTNDFTNAHKNKLENLKNVTDNDELENGAGYQNAEQVEDIIEDLVPGIIDDKLIEVKDFIENSMKTLQTEGTSIHVNDSADYGCNLKIEGKSEQVQTEQGKNLLPINIYEFESNVSKSYTQKIFLKKDVSYKFSYKTEGTNIRTFVKNDDGITIAGAIYTGATINVENDGVYTFDSDRSSTEVVKGGRAYDIQLEEGTTATEFEPFTPDSPSPNYRSPIENVSGDLEVKVLGKNLFNYNSEVTNFGSTYATKEQISNGYKMTATITGGAQRCQLIIPMEILTVGKKYTLSYKSDFNPTQIRVGDASGIGDTTGYDKYGSFNNVTTGKITFTLTEKSKKYLIFALYNANAQTGDTYSIWNIQVEYSETATNYEAYKEQTVTFPLGTQKLMKDGYLDDDGIHNKRKQVVLDGTESYISEVLGSVYLYEIEKNDMLFSNAGKGLCSHFINYTNNYISKIGNIRFGWENKNIYFYTSFPTLEEFKNWLAEQYSAGTPVIVEYVLAEEETTPYTEEQQTAYNALQKLKTYRTVTNISNNQDTKMKLNYKKDLQTQFQELEAMLLESGV